MKKQLEVRHITTREFRVASNADGSKTITGYAALFNTPSVDMGGWKEVVSPSAFTRTLRENPDVFCFFSHDNSKVLGRTKSGTLTLETDQTGLKYSCNLPNTTIANDLAVSIERGDITGCSFGFVTIVDSWTMASDGTEIRTLLDVDLYEITITSEPAYPDTTIALRSAPREVRSRIESRTDTDADGADGVCSCPCPQCVADACGLCSNDDCDDEDCACREFRSSHRDMRERLNAALERMK